MCKHLVITRSEWVSGKLLEYNCSCETSRDILHFQRNLSTEAGSRQFSLVKVTCKTLCSALLWQDGWVVHADKWQVLFQYFNLVTENMT